MSRGRCAKAGGSAPSAPKHLDLHGGVGDVVLAADDVGDAEIDVVDRRGQHVGEAAVGPHHDGIAHVVRLQLDPAAHQVVPDDLSRVQPKAPVRPAAFRLEAAAFVLAQVQRGAVIDRRPAARQLPLALVFQLLRRLVGRIEAAGRAQPLARRLVGGEPLRLPGAAIPVQPEPSQVLLDGVRELVARAFAIGVVDAQQEMPAVPAREQPVDQRRADIADVLQPGRARREADLDGHS